jgi:hypothetical protein
VHSHENIATTDELLVDVKLGYRGPLRVLLDSCRICQLPLPTPHSWVLSIAARNLRTTNLLADPGLQAH